MNNTYKSVINQDLIKKVNTINNNAFKQQLNKLNLIKGVNFNTIKGTNLKKISIKNIINKPIRKIKISSITRNNNTYNISIENINNIQNKINIINNTDIQDKKSNLTLI